MPALKNPKKERYCLERLKGKKQIDACAAAGYARIGAQASRLEKDPLIVARMAELKYEANTYETELAAIRNQVTGENPVTQEITLKWVLTELLINMQLARRADNIREANNCLKMVSELKDFFPKGGKADPNQELPLDREKHQRLTSALNLQIINHLPESMGGSGGKLLEAADITGIPSPKDISEADWDDGDVEPVGSDPLDEGQPGEGLPDRVEGSGS